MASSSVTYNTHSERPEGYPSLAKFISTSADCAVFRKFTELNVRNLFYLQSEILDLEAQLYKHDAEDVEVIAAKLDMEDAIARDHAARSYLQLRRGQRAMDQDRFDLVQRIREVLKVYSVYMTVRVKKCFTNDTQMKPMIPVVRVWTSPDWSSPV